MSRGVRYYPLLLMTASMLFTTLTAAAQEQPSSARPSKKDPLPAGPFLFQPGAARPTFLDAFKERPSVPSPDGSLEITVTGPPKSLLAWVTVIQRGDLAPGFPFPVWPLETSGDVLWAPNSQEFALTDNRYANLSYVLVFGAAFRMGESEPGLGVPITDLTSVVRKAFEKLAQEYYKGADSSYETRLFYAKALRWIGNDQLLVGVSTMTVGPPTYPNQGKREWNVAYLVHVPGKTVVREVSRSELLSQYGIKVFDE